MQNEEAIAWLKSNTKSLKRRIDRLDKKIEGYISEKKELEFDIQENEKLIKRLQDQ